MQTPEQVSEFRKLCTVHGLGESDVWQDKPSGNWIMSRTGAEKVQGHNNIQVDFEVCAAAIDYAIVKATASRTVKPEGKPAKKISVQTLGSANPKNCPLSSYYAEMAEERALVRSVLKIMGLSKLGVYSEQDAQDFTPAQEIAPAPAALPGKSEVEVIGPVSVTPTAPEAPAPKILSDEELAQAEAVAAQPTGQEGKLINAKGGVTVADNRYATKEQKDEIIRLLNHPVITRLEKTKMLININRLDKARADEAITKLNKAITDREASGPSASEQWGAAIEPDTQRAAAAQELYDFAELNQGALGKGEYGRLMELVHDKTKTAAQLLKEKELALDTINVAA